MTNHVTAVQVIYSRDGFIDEEKFVEIEGEKFVADETDPTKAKVGEDGKPVPFKPKADDGDKGKGKTEEEKSLEELAKTNPEVAALLDKQKKYEDDEKKRKEQEAKDAEAKAKKDGQWEQLAEQRKKEAEDAKRELEKKTEILGKYVGSVKEILAEVLKTIPKENLGLIPEAFSPREKLEYITKNAKLLGAKIAGAKGGKVGENDDDIDKDDLAKKEAEFQDLLNKKDRTPAESTKLTTLAQEIKKLRREKEAKK